jgi:hypothetical protein
MLWRVSDDDLMMLTSVSRKMTGNGPKVTKSGLGAKIALARATTPSNHAIVLLWNMKIGIYTRGKVKMLQTQIFISKTSLPGVF